jgi:hypothetical protein
MYCRDRGWRFHFFLRAGRRCSQNPAAPARATGVNAALRQRLLTETAWLVQRNVHRRQAPMPAVVVVKAVGDM